MPAPLPHLSRGAAALAVAALCFGVARRKRAA